MTIERQPDLQALRARAEQWLEHEQWEPHLATERPDTLIRELLAALPQWQPIATARTMKHDVFDNPQKWMRWCDHRALEACEAEKARADRLKAALRKYGQHTHECQWVTLVVPLVVGHCGVEYSTFMGNRAKCHICGAKLNTSAVPVCTCGFSAALTPAAPQTGEPR